MTRRLAGHRRRPEVEPPAAPPAEDLDAARLAWLEHDGELVAPGGHGYDVPCAYCLGRRPGDDLKRIRRQLALELAEASGREYRAIYAMGDALPIRILFADGQPPPELPTLELDADTGLVYAVRYDDSDPRNVLRLTVNINPPPATALTFEGP